MLTYQQMFPHEHSSYFMKYFFKDINILININLLHFYIKIIKNKPKGKEKNQRVYRNSLKYITNLQL